LTLVGLLTSVVKFARSICIESISMGSGDLVDCAGAMVKAVGAVG
jgi:hypothetical protein